MATGAEVIRRFKACCEADELWRAYEWRKEEPFVLVPREIFKTFYAGEGREAGWASLKPLPTRRKDYELVLGVFPEYRGDGLGGWIVEWAEDFAERSDADSLTQVIFGENTRRLRTMLREDLAGSAWRYAGVDWYPDAVYRFVWVPPGKREKKDGSSVHFAEWELRRLEHAPESGA